MPTRHSTHARTAGRCRHVGHIDKLDVENEIGLGWDPRVSGVWSRPPARAICQLPGDEQAAFAANLHTFESLIEARNEAAHALRKGHWLRLALLRFAVVAHDRLAVLIHNRCAGMVVRRIELVPIGGQPTRVVDFVELVGLRHSSGANLVILVAQGESGLDDSLHYGDARRQLGG